MCALIWLKWTRSFSIHCDIEKGIIVGTRLIFFSYVCSGHAKYPADPEFQIPEEISYFPLLYPPCSMSCIDWGSPGFSRDISCHQMFLFPFWCCSHILTYEQSQKCWISFWFHVLTREKNHWEPFTWEAVWWQQWKICLTVRNHIELAV